MYDENLFLDLENKINSTNLLDISIGRFMLILLVFIGFFDLLRLIEKKTNHSWISILLFFGLPLIISYLPDSYHLAFEILFALAGVRACIIFYQTHKIVSKE